MGSDPTPADICGRPTRHCMTVCLLSHEHLGGHRSVISVEPMGHLVLAWPNTVGLDEADPLVVAAAP